MDMKVATRLYILLNLKMNGTIKSLSLQASITCKETHLFYVHVTVHHNFFVIKPLISQIYFGMKLYMFRTVSLTGL